MSLKSVASVVAIVLLFSSCDRELKDLIDSANRVTPADYLSADVYTSLQVEIVYVDGFPLNAVTLNNLKETLQARLNKPGGIEFITRGIPAPGVSGYTVDQLRDIEEEHRTRYPSGERLTAFIFVADKPYVSDGSATRVLGLYYGRSSVAVFEKTVRDGSGGFGQPGGVVMETWVLVHEIGHLLGLVDNGSAMQEQHEDKSRSGHCNNDACIMHFESDARLLSGVPAFDVNCLNDLRANGGK